MFHDPELGRTTNGGSGGVVLPIAKFVLILEFFLCFFQDLSMINHTSEI